jgi:hypothetical protein
MRSTEHIVIPNTRDTSAMVKVVIDFNAARPVADIVAFQNFLQARNVSEHSLYEYLMLFYAFEKGFEVGYNKGSVRR